MYKFPRRDTYVAITSLCLTKKNSYRETDIVPILYYTNKQSNQQQTHWIEELNKADVEKAKTNSSTWILASTNKHIELKN